MTRPPGAEVLFADSPLGLSALDRVATILDGIGPVQVRTTRSQVAFRHRRGFAWLWLPGRWLRHPGAEVVLSIGLPRHDPSARWKQVVEPRPGRWMHHLELRDVEDLDAEVAGWLAEAWAAAG